jgi:hypothetical protein
MHAVRAFVIEFFENSLSDVRVDDPYCHVVRSPWSDCGQAASAAERQRSGTLDYPAEPTRAVLSFRDGWLATPQQGEVASEFFLFTLYWIDNPSFDANGGLRLAGAPDKAGASQKRINRRIHCYLLTVGDHMGRLTFNCVRLLVWLGPRLRIDDSLGEGSRCFLREVVADPATDQPVLVDPRGRQSKSDATERAT